MGKRARLRHVWSLVVAAALAACAAHGGAPVVPAAQTSLARPPHDLGRRDPHAPVEIVVALRFNREAELLALVDDLANPASPRFRRFLSAGAFDARFAPSVQQERRVLDALRSAGFTIVRTDPDRTLIAARAPSGVVERFFATRIHDFDQGVYGTRYANVRPATVPAGIAPLVLGVELNSIVYARPAERPDNIVNVIRNGGFEHPLPPWYRCGSARSWRTTEHPWNGRYDLLLGSQKPQDGEPKGYSAVCQTVTIPLDASLSAYLYENTNETALPQGFAEIALTDDGGKVVRVLYRSSKNHPHWHKVSWSLKRYARQRLNVFFGVTGSGRKKFYDQLFVDSVALVGMKPTPTPSGGPTPTPTPVGPGSDVPLTGPTTGPAGGWWPRGIADAFDFPVQHGYDGKGAKIGVVMFSAYKAADLATFYTANGIASHGTVTAVPVDGGPGTGDPTEVTLDVEAIAGLAPGADVFDYETPDLSNASVEKAYATALSEPAASRVSVLDSSFTECESADTSFDAITENDAVHGAALGMTFVAASGDEGSACYNGSNNVKGTYAPGSDPHFIAVGGNQSLEGSPATNPVSFDSGGGVSGGGVSGYWGLPTYQQGVAGLASSAHRNVPDLALPAVDDDVLIFNANENVDGTSWSSAILTALLGETVEICGPLGYANPMLYSAFSTYGEGKVFLDVTSGSNAFASIPGYTAGTGYDNVSGIGMPNGISFSAAMCGTTTTLLDRGSSPKP